MAGQPAGTFDAESVPAAPAASGGLALRWLAILALVYVLLIGVGIIGNGFSWVSGGAEGAESIFAFASNPIVAVIMGTLATALVQSSSTVSSVIVGLVSGGLPVSIAVPMIMGSNMGTTITNTFVSLGNIREDKAFGRSFAAATVHDFFNLYAIVIFLPIEMLFHPLERLAGVLSDLVAGEGSASIRHLNFVRTITRPVVNGVEGVLGAALPDLAGGLLMIAIGIACVIASVLYLGKLLRSTMTGRARGVFNAAIGRGPLVAILSGTLITILVQSSSTTTSLIVPFAGAGILTLMQVFPFTLGANIGTCITALLAATAVTGAYEELALQVALVHLLYNVLGVVVFCVIPFLYSLPLKSAEWLARAAEQSRAYAFGYIVLVFFALPGLALGGQAWLGQTNPDVLEAEAEKQQLEAAEKAVHAADFQIE